MIMRGTTPFHSFILPFTTADISDIYITYIQNGQMKVEKTGAQITLEDITNDDSNGFITDENSGDSFGSNDANATEPEDDTSYCQATVHLTQEDTLNFDFFKAAEKNIAVIQIRLLVDGEAYASFPVKERIFGVLKDGTIPETQENI